jgi:hypothetical protein
MEGQMTGSGVQEIAAGIWCWQRRPRGLRPGEFGARTSYVLTVGGETLLVDPLVEGDDDPALRALDDLAGGRVRILISKPFHTRSAEQLAAAEELVPARRGCWRTQPGPARRSYVTPTRVPGDGLERVGRCAAIAVARSPPSGPRRAGRPSCPRVMVSNLLKNDQRDVDMALPEERPAEDAPGLMDRPPGREVVVRVCGPVTGK